MNAELLLLLRRGIDQDFDSNEANGGRPGRS